MTGSDIKKIRIDKGWTQQEMANKVGYSRDYIEKIENERCPMSKRLVLILKSLGIIKNI